MAIAVRHGIVIAEGFKFLANDGCRFASDQFAEPEVGWAFTNFATSAVLEGLFMCEGKAMYLKLDGMRSNARLRAQNVTVVDYEQSL